MSRLPGPLLAVLLAAAAACGPDDPRPGPAVDGAGESWVLFRGLAARPRLALTVPSGPCEEAAVRLAARLEARGELAAELDPLGEAGDAVRVLAGAPDDPLLAPLAEAIGLVPIPGGYQLLGRDFVQGGDALVAVFEDPEHSGRPVCVFLGNDLEQLAAYLDALPRLSRPWLSAWSDGEPALECPLALDGRPRAEEVRDLLSEREAYFSATEPIELPFATIRARRAPEVKRVQAYGRALAGAQAQVKQWLGTRDLPRVELYFYEHLEDFRRCVGTEALYVASRLRPRVHVLFASGMPDDAGAGLARVLAREAAGAPAAPWLADGLAVAAAGSWWGRPLDEWIAHLGAGKLLPPLAEVLADDADTRWSEHLLGPARGLVFSRAAAASGGNARRTLALWKGAELEPQQLEALYRRGVLELVERGPGAQGAARGRARARAGAQAGQSVLAARVAGTPFRHGIALVEDDLAPYGSRAFDQATEDAGALAPAPDAASLTVLACARDPLAPPCGPRASRLASASDLALASAAAAARRANLRLFLSLEVLRSATGAWADVRAWAEPDDVERYFDEYRGLAVHYGLVAELLRADLLSFGSNLATSIRTEREGVPDPERLEKLRAGWKDLVATLRGACSSPLTCTTKFPEANDVGLYEEIDFIGLQLWPRLARVGVPDDSELRRSLRFELQQGIDLAVRWNRPLVIAQVGYPARSLSWSRPSVPQGAYDALAQLRFHEALADVLAGPLENGMALRGFYLWNWSGGAGSEAGGFSLRGSPALSALERMFAR